MITITDKQLARFIEKEQSRNGKIYWNPAELPLVKIAVRTLGLTCPEDTVLLDGVLPYWLYLGLVATLSPQDVALNSPNFGPVVIPHNTPAGTGSGVTFSAFEGAEFTLIQFSSPRYMQAEQLKLIVPPAVNPRKGVVISSKAPPWLIATVGLAYAQPSTWVACTQKVGNPVVAISNDKSIGLGTELDRKILRDVLDAAAREAIPRRGEVWLFDDGYGEHYGIVVSPDIRNKMTNDILLVPLTTSDKQARHHLAVSRELTGLNVDCFAQCSGVSRIAKTQLVNGPISVVVDELMTMVTISLRKAFGDEV